MVGLTIEFWLLYKAWLRVLWHVVVKDNKGRKWDCVGFWGCNGSLIVICVLKIYRRGELRNEDR